MKKQFSLLVITASLFLGVNVYSQGISIGGQLGWGIPKGDVFEANGEKLASGGLSLDVDALYHFEKFNYKLGAGITYSSSILFGKNSDAGFDIGLFGLNLYGIKANYNFFESAVTPYVALSTGLSKFSTPEISDGNGNVISPSEKSYGFGLKPEIGLDLGGFLMSASYFVPMKYNVIDEKAGVLTISLGFRYNTF